jgi:hypothetical protein
MRVIVVFISVLSINLSYEERKDVKGDVYYWQSDHTGIVEENLKFVEFSPEKEFNEVLAHIAKKMEG